jgi:HD superfamily phosphodiesterase
MKMPINLNTISIINLVNLGFNYVIETSFNYKIDESHALKHSMEVFGLAKKIYENEVIKNPYLEKQKEIIFMAAIGHDMCDKKYMDEKEGILKYKNYLQNHMNMCDIEIIGDIIERMSYSKVKVLGYPELGNYQLAYHIVREADLLSAYDIDRCIIYTMYRDNCSYSVALEIALKLFENRVLKMRKDKLFTTFYGKKESFKLHKKAKKDFDSLKNIFKN